MIYTQLPCFGQSYFTIQTAGPDSFLQDMEESKSNVFIDIVRFQLQSTVGLVSLEYVKDESSVTKSLVSLM